MSMLELMLLVLYIFLKNGLRPGNNPLGLYLAVDLRPVLRQVYDLF